MNKASMPNCRAQTQRERSKTRDCDVKGQGRKMNKVGYTDQNGASDGEIAFANVRQAAALSCIGSLSPIWSSLKPFQQKPVLSHLIWPRP